MANPAVLLAPEGVLRRKLRVLRAVADPNTVRDPIIDLDVIRKVVASALVSASALLAAPLCAQTFVISDGASWAACSGHFYDGGGSSGGYGNNENMTATLCPGGGSGSGPLTSVHFVSWAVDPVPGDQLTIHDGADVLAPVLAVGSSSSSLAGITVTATGPTGCLTFHWVSDGAGTGAGWSADVTTGPSAGTNASTTVCSNAAPFNMFVLLGSDPDVGGAWTAPGGGGHSNMFDPAVDPGGVYTYTASGPAPCPDSVATLTITKIAAANAGTNGSTTVCSNAASFSLFGLLGGSPSPGGAWTLGGAPVSGTYVPGTSTPGIYTYTVVGVPPCTNATATVTVNQVQAPVAGQSQALSVCSNEASFALISKLGGTPDPGGSWSGPGGFTGSNFNPAVNVTGIYTYTVAGTAPCANQNATLDITVQAAPNAGSNGSVIKCSTDGSIPLIGVLGGTPDANGTWSAPGGGPNSGTFVPGTSTPGIYTYTVAGTAPCAPAVATATINVNTAPNAGINGSITVCSDASSFSLFAQLGGSPNAGGGWTGPGGGVHANTFVPGTDPPGVYTYAVTGLAPCSNATATVTVSVVVAPNPGTNASVTKCSIDGAFALFNYLGGTPNGGGTWTMPGGAAHSGTFVPGTDPAGTYTYKVTGTPPCSDRIATVQVIIVNAANAGTNGSLTICSDDAAEPLFNHLGGTPQSGGAWTRPGGTSFGGTYNPANVNHVPGVYTYTVTGTAPCPNASATVLVVENQAPNAGNNGSVTKCSTDGPFNLLSVLGGTPDGNGSWLSPSNAPVSSTFTPGSSVTGVYKYIVPALPACDNDTALATVSVNTAPNAGINGSFTICSNNLPENMFSHLGGSPDAGGSWVRQGAGSHSNMYNPASDVSGVFIYTVTGAPPCANASATITVTENQQPSAGLSNSVQVCSDNPPFQMINFLGGGTTPGGSWTLGGSSVSGTFTPGTSTPGVYTYTVIGTAPCTNASANVTVSVNPAPYAGLDGDLTVCSDQGLVDLFTALGPTYDPGGNWTDDDATGQLSGSLFSPAGLPPGDYDFTYHVAGGGPCGSDQAHVEVTIVSQLNAGTNGSSNVCSSQMNYNLFNCLGGGAQQGGIWIDLNGTGALSGNFFNASMVVAPGSYQFRYKLTGSVSCASDSSTATVNVIAAPTPFSNGTATFCSNGSSTPLINYLGGSPQPGGNWSGPPPPLSNGSYNPPTNNPGVYTYTVVGMAPCANVSATVTVTENPKPDAGISSAKITCSNSGAFNMTAQLGGTPSSNGIWRNPANQIHSATFDPQQDPPGVWTYTVAGVAPCADAVSSLNISVNPAPYAGANAQYTTCSNGPPVVLFNLLTGAQAGGTWTNPYGQAHSGVYVPGIDSAGVYTYTVTGTAPCAPSQATVTVFEYDAATAGCNSSITVCTNGGPVNLFDQLGCSPDPTGSWTLGGVPVSGTFTPGSTAGSFVFLYTVPGIPPCTDQQSTVTVTVNQASSAGTNGSRIVCSNETAFSLITVLGGTPGSPGTWSGPSATPGVFVPGTSAPGTFTYTVPGAAGCPNASATATIVVNQAAYAGLNGSAVLCSTTGATPLFPYLTGTPQTGGTWKRPNHLVHSGIFLPGTDAPGVYTYVVNGLSPCLKDSATVTVTVNQQPNAGSNGSVTVCSNNLPFQLFPYLNGSPDLNGTWSGPPGTPGIFIPGTNQAGIFTYTVTGLSPCQNAQATVTVTQITQANAGQSNVVTICSDQPQFNLFSQLLGTPQAGGSWSGGSGGIYIPGTSPPGPYTYTVTPAPPCTAASATVTVVQSTAANAGINTTAQVCSSQSPMLLTSLLAGSPDASGSWVGPGGPHGSILDPAVDVSGSYTYTVTANAPCSTAVSTVQVTIIPAPNAGISSAITACVNTPAIDLFAALGGTPQTGGTWTDVDNTGQVTGNSLNATGLLPGVYHFIYTKAGTGPCPNASATVTVNLTDALDAGTDNSIQVCSSQAIVDLFANLGGTPQPGGVWIDLNGSGALTSGVFNATAVPVNSTWPFRYVLASSSLCVGDSALLTVEVLAGPNAGQDNSPQYCSTGASVNMGVPAGGDAGGTWYGPGGAPFPGPFVPGTSVPGVYTYVVAGIGNCPADSAHRNIGVTPAPNAGTSGTISFCSDQASYPLFNALGGSPQSGGTWQRLLPNPPVPHSGIYNPPVDAPGVYAYTIAGQAPCANATALVTVAEAQAPNAGCNAPYSVCSSSAPFNMRLQLGCTPQTGGTWYAPGGASHNSTFDPAVDVSGSYTYVLTGLAPCVNDTAVLLVSVTQAANAGTDSTFAVCVTSTSVDLFSSLGGSPDMGGSWVDLDGSGALTGVIFDPSVAGVGQFHFRYRLVANGPCPADSSTLTVNVFPGANPGTDSSLAVCGAWTAFDLFSALGGTPDPGGIWVDLLGTGGLTGSILDPSVLAVGTAGSYGYVVGAPGCGDVSATVQVTVAAYPDPGVGTTVPLCSTGSSTNLLAHLTGTPDQSGTWTGPNGLPHSSTFTPSVDAAGNYTYTVTGVPPCADSSAVVTVMVNAPANAGIDGALLTCDTTTALDLFPGLAGTPQTGGTWSDPGATGALNGGTLAANTLTQGQYPLIYTVDVPGCPSDEATVVVTVVDGVVVGDLELICNEQYRTYTVAFTISGGDPGSYSVAGVEGTLTSAAPYRFTSSPILTSDDYTIIVDDQYGCGARVLEGSSPCIFDEEVFVPQSFSPNGDNINDVLFIPGIEGFPLNHIEIFNRWGDVVYSETGYDNASKSWDGRAIRAGLPGELPTGTYFYVLDLGTGADPFKGFIYLNR